MKQFSIKALGLLILMLAFGWVQAQNAEPVQQLKGLGADPSNYDASKAKWVADHPQEYQNITSTERKADDQATMPWGAPENKAQWIADHPAEYAAMNSAKNENAVRMSKEQFNAYPADKQAAIKQDPNYIIED